MVLFTAVILLGPRLRQRSGVSAIRRHPFDRDDAG
jgi:hypothetical protein